MKSKLIIGSVILVAIVSLARWRNVESDKWATYSNHIEKYAMNYPENWMLVEDDTDNRRVVFGLSNPDDTQKEFHISISAAPLPPGGSLKQLVDTIISLQPESRQPLIVLHQTRIDGEAAIELLEVVNLKEKLRLMGVVIAKANTTYTIWSNPDDPGHPMFAIWASEGDAIFDKIKSSFRFLD